MTMRAHKLKTWPRYFQDVKGERKPFDVRKADRDFRVGDYLCLVEFDPTEDMLTGQYVYRRVTYVLTDGDPPRGLCAGFVVLGLETCDSGEIEHLRGQYRGSLPRSVEWLAALPVAA